MSDNIRIKATPGGGDKNVNVKINQKFDFIEILSLKISQDEAYRRFCSDYGVVVGRVIVNNGVGVPNVKVSIFIPIDEVDLEDEETKGLYPFEVITDTNGDGIPYNLVPRNNRGKDECFTPIGTFPSKREIQDNPEIGEIYCKYYKFTTTTNESGDFMLFGVPVGTHFMHVDADISDIGILSQRPYDLIREGTNEKEFKSTTKFKGRKDSSELTQLKTSSPISVTVPPFWGDTEECRIGIARSDVNLATYIVPSAIFMGALISDNDRHALSRTCKPRKDLGQLKKMVTGDGTIEMIRKTHDDAIERFDVEGGQVIDEDGTWAYQIPMNREYMTTAEDGSFVPSGDPSIGIPTKARVRFRVSMSIDGDEGRLRTRAKYLVPHNPSTWDGTDFSFNTSTQDAHFTDLSWNKIYTIKNHITRVQARGLAENRNFIGLKNVDDPGPANPFPFNKMDNDLNPIFSILCLIIRIIARIVGLINIILIPLINIMISILNAVLIVICEALFFIGKIACALEYVFCGTSQACSNKRRNCRRGACISYSSSQNVLDCPDDCKNCECRDLIDYLPYITLQCTGSEGGTEYAPGGRKGDSSTSVVRKTWLATGTRENADGTPTEIDFHYPDDETDEAACGELENFPYHQKLTIEGCDGGWSRCQTAGLADALNVFKFDFYNDWINGTLYPFLLKYKIKGQGAGTERFCEADCGKDGVDNDGINGGDNPCKNNKILDTCTGAAPQNGPGTFLTSGDDLGVNSERAIGILGGYIKKFEGELYYTPISKDGDHKLFATDMVNLGSVFDCDWEGVPRFYQYLTDTTFSIPPLIAEYESLANNKFGDLLTSGFDRPGSGGPSLIGDITCFGINTNGNSCNNIKRFCELSVGLDERRNGIPPDNIISNTDVEQPYVRGLFTYLNKPGLSTIPDVYIDDNPGTSAGYPAVGEPKGYDDPAYEPFRNVNKGTIWVYENSYYFYFGLNKGNSALSKMKRKYFSECVPETDTDFFVIANTITPDQAGAGREGAIDISVVGGVGPYTYLWEGPTIGGVSYPLTNNTEDIGYTSSGTITPTSGVYAGTYTVTVIDDVGNTTNGTFIIPGPPAVACDVQTTDVTRFGTADGTITVGISSGSATYSLSASTYDISNGTIISPPLTVINPATPTPGNNVLSNIASGYYAITVEDSGVPKTRCEKIIYISEPPLLTITPKVKDVKCFGFKNGSITLDVVGGVGRYKFLWSPNGEKTQNIGGLSGGTYTVTVEDDNGSTNGEKVTIPITVAEPKKLVMGSVTAVDGNCTTPLGKITVSSISGGKPGYSTRVTGGDSGYDQTEPGSGPLVFDNVPNGIGSNEYKVETTDNSGCTVSSFIEVFVPATPLSANPASSNGAAEPTISSTFSGGIFEALASVKYSYHSTLQKSINGGAWVNHTGPIDRGVNPNHSVKLTLAGDITPPAGENFRYRFKVQDKNGTGCIADSDPVQFNG